MAKHWIFQGSPDNYDIRARFEPGQPKMGVGSPDPSRAVDDFGD
jgi:hypothetical protein